MSERGRVEITARQVMKVRRFENTNLNELENAANRQKVGKVTGLDEIRWSFYVVVVCMCGMDGLIILCVPSD